MINEKELRNLYETKLKSANEIAQVLGCSTTKVNYWLNKYNIKKRDIGAAVYIKSNPDGDPFLYKHPQTTEEYFLYGLGLGLFWGEGNKVNKSSVRLGNTDPELIRYFLRFLREIFLIKEEKLRFGLQVFSDVDPEVAKHYWVKKLAVSKQQFQKVVVTPQRGIGTYTKKNKYGVLTVYFSNTKLRGIIVDAITELQNDRLPT